MKVNDQEHYELMDMFERDFKGWWRFEREPNCLWSKKQFYQNGDANRFFLAYRLGYSFGKSVQSQIGDIV